MGGVKFNRGMVKNIGFVESIKDLVQAKKEDPRIKINWNCFVFHDVDLIPEIKNIFCASTSLFQVVNIRLFRKNDTRIECKCDRDYPKHYAHAVSKYRYEFVQDLFVVALNETSIFDILFIFS